MRKRSSKFLGGFGFRTWKGVNRRNQTKIRYTTGPKPRNSNYLFLGPFFFSFNNRKHDKLLKPYFWSVLTNIKKEFSKTKLETEKFGRKKKQQQHFCTLFLKTQVLGNCQTIGHKKHTHRMIAECFKKSLETTIK